MGFLEIVTHTLHNLYTLRGAKTRDVMKWYKDVDKLRIKWGNEAVALFASHHWPTWGHDDIQELLVSTRDVLKYLHDQTLFHINQGVTLNDMPSKIILPNSLSKYWNMRGYYGSVSHNVRAIYNFYIGYYDGNVATLDPIPTCEKAKLYVDAIGGKEAVLKQVKNTSNSKWAIQLLNDLMKAGYTTTDVKNQLHRLYTELGYKQENALWRNSYLQAAQELKKPLNNVQVNTSNLISQLSIQNLFEYLGTCLISAKVDGVATTTFIKLDDETIQIDIYHSVLHYHTIPNKDNAYNTTLINFVKQLKNNTAPPHIKETLTQYLHIGGNPKFNVITCNS